ncbi:unnamed protein product [Coregonus sp. 'balchen']|nr:unnamed protein product [Coregonus sp. 'balchen']
MSHVAYISVFYSSPTHLTVGMEPWLRNVLILAACCYGDVIATEGEQVTLGCQFDAVDINNLYLFWYKHKVNGFPKFMLGRFSVGSANATEFKERFDAHLDKDSKSVPLTIQRLQLSDSAVYYCALKPTVTTGYTAPLQKHTELHNDNTPSAEEQTVLVSQREK